jgi:hypothetical protein
MNKGSGRMRIKMGETETKNIGTQVLVPQSFFSEYNKVCIKAAEWLQLCDLLAEALQLGGEHEGPCDPDSAWEGCCNIHWRAAEQRRWTALDTWKKVRGRA